MGRFLGNLQNNLVRFMMGRNGPDALARTALWAGVILTFVEMLTGWGIFSLLGLACLLYSLFRCFSRNIMARSRENATFLAKTAGMRTAWRRFNARWDERKVKKFVKCPQCKQSLSVPKGKGKLRVTCPKCGTKFDVKS